MTSRKETEVISAGYYVAFSHCGGLPLAVGAACGEITLGKPLAGVHQLDDIDELLKGHDGEGDAGDDPRPGALKLVCTCHLEGTGTPGAGKEARWLRVGRVSGLGGGWLGIGNGLQKRRRQGGRREREEVEADKEGLVQGTTDEKNDLKKNGKLRETNLFRRVLPCWCSTGT